ncbi:succinate dehydrogenase/fumarate reductase iron-sulfur subunit [Haloferax denitrificans]|uniref:Succinate dehydrogenase and fumarate reductase iron-sulfur protein n=1 Tax=Haloferax denitrificans ATCC 35960 TaxID=662478 RepID=M0JI43_9EURY|nr:succinate dehydrogenase/fumarate reductase iron-sulfur subunit [Haloferax denitrificans]EMA08008.1 succinate dehydrogenase and fumarate reductase iron-sulfur protein [Haloferax denitrificans ATCC 35960]
MKPTGSHGASTPTSESDDEITPQQRRLARKQERGEAARSQAVTDASAGSDAETAHLKVFRYDPDVESKREPRFDDFYVPYKRGMTVLDALIYARDEFDSSLTFRHSCRMAVCGSDGFFINGRQRLGCQTQISGLDEPIRVEPLPHQPVIKDLVVDMDHFYERIEEVEPYFQPDELPDDDLEEQRQSPENREKIKMASRCIQCGCCTSSCNPAQTDDEYIGPAAIVKAYRFYFDEREGKDIKEHRLELLDMEDGVWQCHTQFSCTTVCPKDIPITEEIQELKRESVKRDLKFW